MEHLLTITSSLKYCAKKNDVVSYVADKMKAFCSV